MNNKPVVYTVKESKEPSLTMTLLYLWRSIRIYVSQYKTSKVERKKDDSIEKNMIFFKFDE